MPEQATLPVATIAEAIPHLRRPFAPEAIKWKIQTNPKKDGGFALVVGYIDSRLASERLNAVLPGGWSETFEPVEGGMRCTISLHSADDPFHPISHTDVGWSKGTGNGMDLKALYSDAFKRAAVKCGVGVSLYALPQQFLKDDGTDLKSFTARSGKSYKITDAGLKKLRAAYEKWLKGDGAVFGDPLSHGDVFDAQGDIEAGDVTIAADKDVEPEADKPKRTRKPKDQKPGEVKDEPEAEEAKPVSAEGVRAINDLMEDRPDRAQFALTFLTAADVEKIDDLTAERAKELFGKLKALEA